MDILSGSTEALLSRVGSRLRQLRLEANLSREQLAAETGVSADTVRNAESGRNVSLETLVSLLRGLGELERLQVLLDDAGPSPVSLARRQGLRRQRASGRRRKAASSAWKW
jgi:transcriptional regulator with XRE-family HTH domain